MSVFQHTVTVVKIDGFEFVEDLDLSGVTIQIDAGEIILENAVVHGDGWQQRGNLGFRWDSGMQTLILIHSENVGLEAADTEPDPDATPLPPDDSPTYNVTPTTIDLALVEVGATR